VARVGHYLHLGREPGLIAGLCGGRSFSVAGALNTEAAEQLLEVVRTYLK